MIGELLPDFTRLVTEEGQPADALLNTHLRAHRELGSRDRRFLSSAVFSYFRWYGWTVGQLNLSPVEACLVGHALDSTEIAESFAYMEKLAQLPSPLEPLGNASLTEKAAKLNEWFRDVVETPLDPTSLVPSDFSAVVDPEKIAAAIEQFQKRPPTWIRARTDGDSLITTLAAGNVTATAHPTVEMAISLDGGVSLAHLLAKQAAQYTVQDIASQSVGLVAAPNSGEDWWDCCAGAGGKALLLMDLMGQDGKVLATDVRNHPLKALKKRARALGIRNIRTQPFNAVHDEPFRKTFDGVLVDAPCSGWGTWPRNPDARWRTSKREVVQCANRQLKILSNASWCVKPGGALIYAVCTFTRPETEEVVMHFLDKHPNFQLESFTNPITGEQTDGQLQIWPWDGPGDGMFIARLTRSAE
jgi:16S rRNA (cytosine967-C5)-methyltransferase